LTEQDAVNVSTVLELMFAIVREVTITGQTSISSVAIGRLAVPFPPNRAIRK
jgi:hypothetical protein